MAGTKTASVFAGTDSSEADYRKKKEIDLEFERKRLEMQMLAEQNKANIGKNIRKRDQYEAAKKRLGQKADAKQREAIRRQGLREKVEKPTYIDTLNHDLFGEGSVEKPPEPWMPLDTTRTGDDKKPMAYERGQGAKLSFSDTQPGGSKRFTAAFETPEFKRDWIETEMNRRGYSLDGVQDAETVRARTRVEAMWRKQSNEWRTKKGEFLLNEYREQGKSKSVAQPAAQPASAEAQGAAAQDRADAAGTAAAASPVKITADYPVFGSQVTVWSDDSIVDTVHRYRVSGRGASSTYGKDNVPSDSEYSENVRGWDLSDVAPSDEWITRQNKMREAEGLPVQKGVRIHQIRSADGRATIEGDFTGGQASKHMATLDRVLGDGSPKEAATGARVKGTTDGRYIRGGYIFFGNDKDFEKAKRNAGVFA